MLHVIRRHSSRLSLQSARLPVPTHISAEKRQCLEGISICGCSSALRARKNSWINKNRMADKQATVYIIDQGRSMGERHSSRDESDFDYGMRYVWDKITTTLLASRATWAVGVVGLRTDRTDNDLKDDEAYSHISITQPLSAMKMHDLKRLQEAIKVNKTEDGDAISAIIVAIEMIMKFTRNAKGEPLKYARKIVLMTNGRGAMDADDIDEVAKKLNEDNIDLVIV